ncbi:MAG: HAD family phosphatase [Kaiparowitsia implicata GSE-PSE-MK54-09C]|jgi:HAD superfamily hydrolase (TIGR01509 family)|nr:HAD family phosphatase [Kaiparowitsia implicata GSE-PSE-MK54-09C]
MLNALLFDLDGTLANTDPLHCAIWQEVLAEKGMTINETDYREKFSGRLNENIIQDLLPELSPEENQAMAEAKEGRFRDRAPSLEPLAGVLDILNWTDAHGLKKAVVTNAPIINARHMLQALQLTQRFPVVVMAEELPRGKPDPLPYQTALDRLGVSAAGAIAFEDSPSGVQSAVAAGLVTVAIASSHDPDQLASLGATLVIDDFTDLRLEALLRSALPTAAAYRANSGSSNATK